MTLVVEDTFTSASDVAITAHTGETGATWAAHPSDSSGINPPVVDGGSDELREGNTVNNSWHYASGSPANADWHATITFRNRASAGTGQNVVVGVRMTTTNPLNAYLLFYVNAATPYFRLYKFAGAGPTATQLGSDYTYTLPAADTDVEFYVVGSEIRVYKNDGTLMISATDTAITAAGKLGVRFSDVALTGATGGIVLTRIQGFDGAVIPDPQTVTVGTASETDSAYAITMPDQTVNVGTASETDSAYTVGLYFDQSLAVGVASETDSAAVIVVPSATAVGAQGGLAWLFTGIVVPLTVTVGTATETDTAFSVTTPADQTITVGTASEADSGIAIVLPGTQTIAVGVATETDTALVIYPPGTIIVRPEFLPAGTAVGAYRRWEWKGSELARLGAGPGAAVKEAVVNDDLQVLFAGLEDGEWVLYAPTFPNRRLFFMVGQD